LTPGQKNLLVVGLLTFIAGVILLFPARVAYQWLAPDGVSLGGIQGSIWSGTAREVNGGGLYLRDLRWRMRPLRLFTGKLGFDVEAVPGNGFVEAGIALGLGGAVSISKLTASGSLQTFAGMLNMPVIAS
jgi:hypothetical protein